MIKTVRLAIRVLLAPAMFALSVATLPAQAIEFRRVTACCPGGTTEWRLSKPAFSPDAHTLAYCDESQYTAADKPVSAIEFLVLHASGGAPFMLTPSAWGGVTAPAWSPDGQYLAFACETADPARAGIWVAARQAGSGPRALTRWVAGLAAHEPAWLPDGNGLVYSSSDGLWKVLRPDGAPERIPVNGPGSSPSCARGGLAYVRENHIWVYDGERNRQLTWGTAYDSAPAISSDAEWIVFVSNRGGQSDLWVISAGGGTPVRVTNDAAEDADPTWSAAGDQIAFVSWRGGDPNIWLATTLPRFTVGTHAADWGAAKRLYRAR